MPIFYSSESIKNIRELVNTKIHWYGFSDLETKPESYHTSLVKILCAIDYDYSYPMLVYLLNTRIADLEKLTHTDITHLNTVGITIYLNEPLSLYYSDNTLCATELDSVLIYMANNNLHNVTVYTCDYRCEQLLPKYTTKMKLITNDIFIKTLNRTVATLPTDQFTKKFINLNWRYTDHRHLTAAFMSQLSSNCSWKYNVDDAVTKIYDWADIPALDDIFNGRISNGLQYLKENSPLILDVSGPVVPVANINNIHDIHRPIYGKPQNIEQFYADSFCDIVTETKYAQLLGNISEKTFKPIGYLKPFILVAPPYCLEYLRTMGYKTFSDYWDESYDTETNDQDRLIKIFKLVDHINSMSIDELKQLYNEMLPTLIHNNSVLSTQFSNKAITQKINSTNQILRRELWKHKIHPSRMVTK